MGGGRWAVGGRRGPIELPTAFKPYIAVASRGAPLARDEARAAFSLIFEARRRPRSLAPFSWACDMRGETVDEIIGAARGDARRHDAGRGAAGRHRHRRHRAATAPAPIISRPLRRSSPPPPARSSPSMAARRRHRRSGASDVLGELGVKVGISPGRRRRLPARGRHLLHGRDGAPSGHASRRARESRARRAHDLQPARSALQSRARRAADDRRLLARLARTPGPVLSRTRREARLAAAWRRRPRRGDDDGDHRMSSRSKTARSAPSKSRRRTPGPAARHGPGARRRRSGA